MTRIRQLPPSVVTRIAAGEVIERPASVVKELLENSLDAGSTRIEIDIEEGGSELIRIVDDGHGIHADDMPLAFANHATSKLATADDLFCVRTMGFRGEALASIGGVAHVTLQSRPTDSPFGAEIACHGDNLSAVRLWNGSVGTRIEVRHLFFNTPVRRKFLKTTGTEMGHICETVTRIALAVPGLHLTLRHNGKEVHEIPGSTNLRERIGLFQGAEVRDALMPVQAEAGPVRLHGFIADPSCDRGTNKLQYIFLNRRWIRDRSLGHAIQEAYRGLLMTGRYAVCFLFLEMPPDHVDVNVHPTKVEVRFRDSQALYRMILATLRDRLRSANLVPSVSIQPTPPGSQPMPALSGLPSLPQGETFSTRLPDPPMAPPQVPADPAWKLDSSSGGPPGELFPRPLASKAIQLHDAYLVLETPEGMLVVDQHALHERILFEQFKARIRSGPLETQRLLVPEPIELRPEEAAKVLELREALARLGLEVEGFGGNTVLISGYPAILGERSPSKMLRSVIDYLMTQDRLPSAEVLLNDLLSLMACHAAVRAGDPLKPEEIEELLKQRGLAEDTHHCPHGRPTALLFSRQDLDRHFRRI